MTTTPDTGLDAELFFPSLSLFFEIPSCVALQMTAAESSYDRDWTEGQRLSPCGTPGLLAGPSYAPQPTSSLVSWPSALTETAWDYLKLPRKAERDSALLALALGACRDTVRVYTPLISSPMLKRQSGRELLSNYPV